MNRKKRNKNLKIKWNKKSFKLNRPQIKLFARIFDLYFGYFWNFLSFVFFYCQFLPHTHTYELSYNRFSTEYTSKSFCLAKILNKTRQNNKVTHTHKCDAIALPSFPFDNISQNMTCESKNVHFEK